MRQGDPLSLLLYLLAIEPLNKKLAYEPRLQGILLPIGSATKNQGYADDMAVLITRQEEMAVAHEFLTMWERASGAHVKWSKSKVLIIDRPVSGKSPTNTSWIAS